MFAIMLLAVSSGCAAASSQTRDAAGPPDLVPATVGPLFSQGMSGPHNCTASVLDSPGGDLILTAAHCLVGSAVGVQFAPGYDDGATPYGVWTVKRAFGDPNWLAGQDLGHDYAILQLEDQQKAGRLITVESVTSGNRLGQVPSAGQPVTVIAYKAGMNDEPVRCATTVRTDGGYPAFDCGGFSGGTSGGPWLVTAASTHDPAVVAVIGGRNYGGCDDATSYSSAFGQPILDLLSRAAAGVAPSVFPRPTGDNC